VSAASSTASVTYAGFWRRLLAFIIDSALVSAVLIPMLIAFYGRDYFYWSAANHTLFNIYGAADLILGKLLVLGLLVYMWGRFGATPGKMLLDCRVVDANSLQPLSWKQAVFRLFGYGVSYLPLMLGFVWMAFDKRKQGLHDKLARTVVVHQPNINEHSNLNELMAPFQ